jgi:sec-independent protein translocase protein TatA
MFGLGTSELIVIGVIVFLIFGAKRLPEIGKGLGGAIREFRQVKKSLGGKGGKPKKGEEQEGGENFQNKLAEKALEQVPGVKKALELKDKVNKVKDVVKP